MVPPTAPGRPWTEVVIHSFGNPDIKDDGESPAANVVFDKSGVIYGVTSSGGLGAGEVYRLTSATPGGTWTYNVLYQPPTPPKYHESGPTQLTLGKDGVLYSTVPTGGATLIGTIFSLTPPVCPGGSYGPKRRFIPLPAATVCGRMEAP